MLSSQWCMLESCNVLLDYHLVYYSLFAGHEASLDTQKEQMDTEMKEPPVYEIPDPPSMMRMKENEAYGSFS